MKLSTFRENFVGDTESARWIWTWAEAYEASGWADEMTELYDEDYVNSFNTDKYQIIGLVLAVPENWS